MQRGGSLPSSSQNPPNGSIAAGGAATANPTNLPSTSSQPVQYSQHQQPMMGMAPQQQNFHQQASTSFLLVELERRIVNLGDIAQRDDLKLKTLQEIWASLDTCYQLPAYQNPIENLMHCFIKLFSETTPQFIAENNTQLLRKLMLEVILRMSSIDAVKRFSRDLQKIMLRLITVENEENAILAIKIIIDQGRSVRTQYSSDITAAMTAFKTMLKDLSAASEWMFITRKPPNDISNRSDEDVISQELAYCYHLQAVTLGGSSDTKYNLIPRATLSVKCLQEVPMLVVFFFQYHKQNIQAEVTEFMLHGLQFLNAVVPNPEGLTTYNQQLADDFCLAQAKFLNFVNIMGKVPMYMDVIQSQGNLLVSGVLQLLEHCPAALITVRKDVLMTLKYFFSCEIRNKFLPVLPRLISETALLGKGFTSVDHLRTFLYQMLADLLHHMRNSLNFPMLSYVAFIFCRQLHDPTVSFQVQIMAARLLNSVTECMVRMESQGEPTRDLIFEVLESLVAKLKTVAVYHLPLLFQIHANELDYEYKPPERFAEEEAPPTSSEIKPKEKPRERRDSVDSVKELEFPVASMNEVPISSLPPPTKEGKFATPDAILTSLWAVTPPPISVSDGRNLIKYILQTAKFATNQVKDTRLTKNSYHVSRERDLYERLLKYGVMCMDVFILPHNAPRNQLPSGSSNRSKDEKDTLESLTSVFTSINHEIFRELFTKYMDFLIERIFKNLPLQILVNTFLVRNEVPFFAEIMLKYLMSRMAFLSVSNEKTSLYVKLFKIIFSAIGTHQPNVEGEKMLKPYLPDLIRQSTTLALSAREPLNYFLLLRALFRSIGGGAHDILYGKFLPLLPNLLQFLNKLQSCQHRIQMRELFVELCLTVPVRLSSLLPYLPLLMDPLVCALNGSSSLVQQGLRTLELCVDNLQPEYLFEHMAPVRGALMQGLWRVVGTSTDPNSANVAFRILGKFGGANRRMLNEPQQLQVVDKDTTQSRVIIYFDRADPSSLHGPFLRTELPLDELMKTAVETMKLCALQGEPNAQSPLGPQPNLAQIPNLHLRQQCMELAKSVLLTALGPMEFSSESWTNSLVEHLKKQFKTFDLTDAPTNVYKCSREKDRQLYINALLVLFYGVRGKDLRQYLKFFNAVLRQLSIQAVLEFVGGNKWIRQSENEQTLHLCMDAAILVDALTSAFSDSNKDFCFSAMVALLHISDTCGWILQDISLVCPEYMSKVPFCRYLVEKLMQLCYGPAWFARLGGASALGYMVDSFPLSFIEDNMIKIVESMVEVLIGTVDEISSGAVDMAIEGLEKLHRKVINKCSPQDSPQVAAENERRLHIFVSYYSKHFFHGSSDVREKMRALLQQCAQLSAISETYDAFIFRFKGYFVKDIERTLNTAPYLSLADATASFDAIYELLSVKPSLYPFTEDRQRWHRFLGLLLEHCQQDAAGLLQRESFKKSESCPAHFLPPIPICDQIEILRANALRALIACYNMMKPSEDCMDFSEIASEETTLHRKMEQLKFELAVEKSPVTLTDVIAEDVRNPENRLVVVALRATLDLHNEIVSTAGMQALVKCAPISLEVLSAVGEETVKEIMGSSQLLPTEVIQLARLFDLNPDILTPELAEKIVGHITNWKPNSSPVVENQEKQLPSESTSDKRLAEIDAISEAIRILAGSQTATTAQQAVAIASFIASFEYTYTQNVSPNFNRNIAKMLARFPKQAIQFLYSEESVEMLERRALFRQIIKREEALPVREELIRNVVYFENAIEGRALNAEGQWKDVVGDNEAAELMLIEREQLTLTLIDHISRIHVDWFVSPTSPVGRMKELWNNAEFKKRYIVRVPGEDDRKRITVRWMTEHKYKVPKLIINCFIRYLRMNNEDYELLFDVLLVFVGNFVTDFCYVREFLEKEIIPVVSLDWRRDAFIRVMEKFETNPEKAVTDLRMVKAIQYLVIPSLHWAFERYDVDTIVGPGLASPETTEEDPANLVSRLAKVVDAHRLRMSDGMVIVFYQLCTLFVQYAPQHIHNNACKRQGGRLRVFMLFAWPCLTLANSQDPTTRYTGFYFLANIIERFTINRRIVLQVFHCLSSTYLSDNRDQIRKAIDILTPAVPMRMEDGHQQILTSVRRVLLEESHNLAHVQHVFLMVVRNYRVYYQVRHELAGPLMAAVQRAIVTPNNVMDSILTRKLAVDVCEMIIKWDLLRAFLTDPQSQVTAEQAMEVDKLLEKLKTSNDKEETTDPSGRTSDSSGIPSFAKVGEKDDPLTKAIHKEQTDQVVNLLIRFALQQPQPGVQPTMMQSAQEMCKRSQSLLRAALKPSVWGNFATIRPIMLEKQMTISQEALNNMRQEGSQSSQSSNMPTPAQQALELILSIINVVPKPLLLQTIRPLQRAIISCLNTGIANLIRCINVLLGKLLERTNHSPNGLDELETLNQYLNKYLNEHTEMSIFSPRTASMPTQHMFTPFSLLRTICSYEPAYLDTVCLQTFIRIMEKAAREHLTTPMQTPATINERDRAINELVSLSLELIRPRIEFISGDTKRYIGQNILLVLIDRSSHEKISENVLRVIGAMISEGDPETTIGTALPLLIRYQNVIDKRFKNAKDIKPNFLMLLLKVFENENWRQTELADRLLEGFHWGLTSPDAEIREKFLSTWENTTPELKTPDVYQRLRFVMRGVDWARFREFFWLRHVFWLILRCVRKASDMKETLLKRKRMLMEDCATFWKTFEFSANLQTMQLHPTNEHMETDDGGLSKNLLTMLEDQKPLLDEAASFDFAESIECVAHIAFGVQDTGFLANVWVDVFKSIWIGLEANERQSIEALIVPFLSSGVHNSFVSGAEKSVLAVWLRAVQYFSPPLPPALIKFISTRHECWHLGMELLERQAICIPRLQSANPFDNPVDQQSQDVLELLADLYSELSELDQFAAVWDRRAVLSETSQIVAKAQLGDWEGLMRYIEERSSGVLGKLGESISNSVDFHVDPTRNREYELWLSYYDQSLKELMHWEPLRDLSNSEDIQNLQSLMLSTIHTPDWVTADVCRQQIQGCVPPTFLPTFTIYNAIMSLMVNEENSSTMRQKVKRSLEDAIQVHISRWRSLPCVVSNAHAKLLQSMNMIREVEECVELRFAIFEQTNKYEVQVLTEMKTVIKVWRNRTPTIADEMSFISLMYDWRCQMHTLVLNKFEEWDKLGVVVPAAASGQSILPIHSAAQGTLAIARAARSLGFYNIALDYLNKLATLVTVPMLDAHQKVTEHVRVLRAMAKASRKDGDEKGWRQSNYEALEILEELRAEELNREQLAKLYCQKACVLSEIGRFSDAECTFSAAAQLVDMQIPISQVATSCMKSWGHYLYRKFLSRPPSLASSEAFARPAVNNYLCAARVDNEPKARKYIARVFWLSKHIDVCGDEAKESMKRVVRNSVRYLNTYNWLYWLPQLMTDIKRNSHSPFIHILIKLAGAYPMQTFYGLREVMSPSFINRICAEDSQPEEDEKPDEFAYEEKLPSERVLRIVLRHRPTDVRVFNRLLSELDEMRELWTERHLRFAIALKDQLFMDLYNQMSSPLKGAEPSFTSVGLIERWRLHLEEDLERHRARASLELTPQRLQLQVPRPVSGYGSARGCLRPEDSVVEELLFENEVPRASDDVIIVEPEYVFVSEMTSKVLNKLMTNVKLLEFTEFLIDWIKALNKRLDKMPKNVPLDSVSNYLAQFTHRVACIEMPFDLMNVLKVRNHVNNSNQAGQYVSMISRFDPRVEIGVRGGKVARRIHLRAQTGKTCSYYLNKSVWEEPINRVSQFFQHVNNMLQKERETARRHLHVPTVAQLRISGHSSLHEISSIQPYMQSSETGIASPAALVEIIHPINIVSSSYADMGQHPDDIVLTFFQQFELAHWEKWPEYCKHLQQHREANGLPPLSVYDGKEEQQKHAMSALNVVYENFSQYFVTNNILNYYLHTRYPDPTMYYMMRKQLAHCLAVLSLLERTCSLTPLYLGDMSIQANTGVLYNPNYRFDARSDSGHLETTTKIVPFRLTPNFDFFLGMSTEGDFFWSMLAVGQCLSRRDPDIILQALLWDEHAEHPQSQGKSEATVCASVTNFVNTITNNIQDLSGPRAVYQMGSLIEQARRVENLVRMPPSYHPWF
ncbi:unnamed protein product [Caenorhabditis auriculariae]|uniref:Non-specific serine/threonine protein kinase n=1 Tax=Caenorhabditis auriculariae TaxID=2777116 RepID=A0A8S1HDR6_9PELO|nr:unnamed protein product [Caenorhabditis auriculariae]